MNNNGWVKLHRKILDNPISRKPAWFSVWVTLLLLANHDDEHTFIWNGRQIELKEGQFITGRKTLSEQTGVPETTIERILDYLESSGQIGQQKNTKNRLITILNWETYQKVDNKRTTNGQQTDTFKNIINKEVKNSTNTGGFQPQAVKKAQFSKEGAKVIKALEAVDPKNKTYYANTTQRASADFLVQEYGLEKVLKVITLLPKTNTMDFCPNITSAYDLKEKWQKLATQLQKIKNNQPILI